MSNGNSGGKEAGSGTANGGSNGAQSAQTYVPKKISYRVSGNEKFHDFRQSFKVGI